MVLECGMGILYGVGVGFDPYIVYFAAILLNFGAIVPAVRIVDRLLKWRKGVKAWLERRLARGQRLIDRYGWIGIVMGVLFLSPIQLAIVGRLLGIKPRTLYPALLIGICIVATVYLGVALGIFKIILAQPHF
jgi:uncharacterized membrane protein